MKGDDCMSEVFSDNQTINLSNEIYEQLRGLNFRDDEACSTIIAKALNCPPAQMFQPQGYIKETIRNIKGQKFQEAFKQDKVTYWSFIGFAVLCPYSLLAPYAENILYVVVFLLGLFLGYRVDRLYGKIFALQKTARTPSDVIIRHKMRMYEPVSSLVKMQDSGDAAVNGMPAVVISGYLSEGLKRISDLAGKTPREIVEKTLDNFVSKYQEGTCGLGANLAWLCVWISLMLASSVMLAIFIAMMRS